MIHHEIAMMRLKPTTATTIPAMSCGARLASRFANVCEVISLVLRTSVDVTLTCVRLLEDDITSSTRREGRSTGIRERSEYQRQLGKGVRQPSGSTLR